MEKPVRSSIQYLSISYECALAIGNSLNLPEMLQEVIHTIVHKTNAHRGIIWVQNKEQELQPIASAGIIIEDMLAQGEIKDLKNVLNQILKKQQFVLRCKDDKDFLQYCPVLTGKEESVLIVPVTNVAVLYLVYAGREIADELLANLLTSLSKKLSVAIEACTAHENIIKEIQVREKAEKELTKKTEQLISSQKELQGLYGESEQARKSLLGILEDVAKKEKALKKTTKLLQSVMDNATDEAIITTDQTGIILIWNEGARRLLGYEPEEVVGRKSIRIFHTKEYLKSGKIDVNIKKILASGKSLTEELDYITKDGKTIPVQQIVSPRFDEDSKFIGMLGMVRDITERRKADEALRVSEQNFRDLVEKMMDGVAIANENAYHIYTNPRFSEITGYSRDELLNMTGWDFTRPEDIPKLKQRMTERIAGKPIQTHYDRIIVKKDGTEIPVEMSTTVTIWQGEKRPLAIIHDITERKNTEEKLRLLSTVVEQSSEGMAVANLDGILTFVNNAWCKMHGYQSSEELLGKNLAIFHNKEQFENEVKPFNEKVRQDGTYSGEVGHITKDGKPFPTLMGTTILKDKQGKPYAFVGIARDITKRKKAEEALRNSDALLTETGRMAKVGGWEIDNKTLELTWTEETYRIHEVPLGHKPPLQEAINFFHPNDRPKLETAIQKALEHGEPYDMELRFITARGKPLWTHSICKPIIVDGKTVKLTGVFQDITERKRVEYALQEREEKYRLLADNTADCIWQMNLDFEFTYVNPSVLQMYGFTQDEWIGSSLSKYCSPEDMEFIFGLTRESLKQSSGLNIAPFEMQLLHKNGKVIATEICSKILFDDHGNPIGLQGSMRDITERKASETALRESEEIYRNIIENIQEVFYRADLGGNLIMASPSGAKILGYNSVEDMLGLNVAKTFYAIPEERNGFLKILEKKGSVNGYEITLKKTNGTLIPAWVSSHFYFDNNGNPLGVEGIIYDLTEQKASEDAIRESEEKLRMITASANDAIIMMDHEGNISYWNKAAKQMFGYMEEEIIGKDLHAFLVPERFHAGFLKGFEGFKETGQGDAIGKPLELAAIGKDGKEFEVELSLSGVKLKGIWNAIGLVRDITERKAMENALRENEERLKEILEHLQTGVVLIDAETHEIVDINSLAARMIGAPKEEIIGNICHKFICPAEVGKCPISDLGQSIDNSERELINANGETIQVLKTVVPVTLNNRPYLIDSFVDISERKRIEENLRKKQVAEEAYTDILTVTSRTIDLNTIVTEGLSNLMKYTDSRLGVVYLCDRDHKMLLPVVTRGAADTVTEQSFLHGEGIVGETAATKEMVVATGLTDTIYKIPSGDGAVTPDTIISTPIIFKDALLGVILTCHTRNATPELMDFIKRVTDQIAVAINNANAYTEIQEMAAELKSERDKLEVTSLELAAASRTKSEFLANMSHELRTPLNSIIGFSEILHDGVFGPVNEKQAKYVNNVLVSGKHLLQLINDILDLSKVEAGKMELDCKDFSVHGAINEVRTLTTSIAAKKRIVLDVSVDESLTKIYADEGKFKQILYNLLSNAIKFTPEHGSIMVHARQNLDMAEISVTDSGIGISGENQKKLFQPFTQADASTSREYGGTGLGLSLVRKFSELLGGTVWVESEPGKGSTFTFTIPIDGSAEAKAPEDTGELEACTGTGSGQGAKSEVKVVAEAKMPENMVEVPAVAKTVTAEEIAAIEMPAIIEPEGASGNEPLILVVEDDENSSEVLTVTLTGAGYRVIPACNGTEALAFAKKLDPFAITLDIMLPGIDGWDVLKYLNYDPETSNIPVIVISMLDETEVGFSLGVVDYFVKPVEKNTLIIALNNLKKALGIARPKVLVVDDEPEAVELVASMIEPAGFEIIHAYGGEEGIKKSFSEHPDVLILDLVMPDVSGFDVVSRLKMYPETRNIPTIICTSKDPTSEDILRLKSNVISIMHKGEFAREQLINEIKRVATLVRR